MSRYRPAIPLALHYPRYRAYWLGTLASVTGFQMFQFSQLWLIHHLTASPLFLGYVGLANAVPAILLNLVGGVVADRFDKRRLITVTQAIAASLIFLLATLTLLEAVEPWHVLTIAFFAGAVNAFDQPARQALYPHLIERSALMSAVALNSSIWQGTRIVAPAMAGVVIATVGTAASIYVGTATSMYLAGVGFCAMAVVIYGLRVPAAAGTSHSSAAQDMLEGLRFITKNSVFSFLIGMTFFNSFFGMSYVMLMPVFAVDILNVGADGQGWLLSLGGVGALLTTIWLSSRGNVSHRGVLIIGGAVMSGLSVATFALTAKFIGSYPLALCLMFASGVFNSAYMVSVMSSLQMMVPDRMRGRVMGFYGMTWSIMPLRGMQAGALASFITVPFAIAVGGLAVAAFALGPATINGQIRRLGVRLPQVAEAASPGDGTP